MATKTVVIWTSVENEIPVPAAINGGDGETNWLPPVPVIPPPVLQNVWQFETGDPPSATSAVHGDEGEWIYPNVLPISPVQRLPQLWTDEQQEMPLLVALDDGAGGGFFSGGSSGLNLIDPSGWPQDERPAPATSPVDEEWTAFPLLPQGRFVVPPPVLPHPWTEQNEIVPQPSATVDELYGALPPGVPPVIPPPSQPVLWLYEQGEQPANLFGQHEEDGFQPPPAQIPGPVRPELWSFLEDFTQVAPIVSEEDGEWNWLYVLNRQVEDRPNRILAFLSGWDIEGVPTPYVVVPPSPTSLVVMTRNTDVLYISDSGAIVPTPTDFTAGTTGPYLMALVGANGQRENLSGATVTLVVQSVNGGTPVVNRQIPVSSAVNGVVNWDRMATETATAGDYAMQAKVVRSDGTRGRYPDNSYGDRLTILPEVGG